MFLFLIIAFLVGFAAVIVSTWIMTSAFEQLVEQQFLEHHDEWVNSGKPVGRGRSRKHASFWISGFAAPLVAQRWLLNPPSWAISDNRSLRLVRRMRIGFAGLLVFTIVTMATLYLFASSIAN